MSLFHTGISKHLKLAEFDQSQQQASVQVRVAWRGGEGRGGEGGRGREGKERMHRGGIGEARGGRKGVREVRER